MLIEELLEKLVADGGSDLHISANLPPAARIDGKLRRYDYPPLSPDDVETLLFPMLSNEQRRTLEQTWELDFSYGIEGLSRFRVNIYKDKGNYAAAFRTITSTVPSFDKLGLPEIVRKTADKPRGLILVTGPTGSGKSTTLAAMIDYINTNRAEHILTIEDPIEFVHTSKQSIIHQRELGMDTRSFANALKSALREDPDIILVGEMRDHETIALALTAAETGHLVLEHYTHLLPHKQLTVLLTFSQKGNNNKFVFSLQTHLLQYSLKHCYQKFNLTEAKKDVQWLKK